MTEKLNTVTAEYIVILLISGALKARAQELTQHITSEIIKLVSGMVNETHALLFTLLITFEKLTSSKKATSREMDIFVKGLASTDGKTTNANKPDWMSKEAWQDCQKVEMSLPCLAGFCDSLQEYCYEWEEYFQVRWHYFWKNKHSD